MGTKTEERSDTKEHNTWRPFELLRQVDHVKQLVEELSNNDGTHANKAEQRRNKTARIMHALDDLAQNMYVCLEVISVEYRKGRNVNADKATDCPLKTTPEDFVGTRKDKE